MFKRNTCFTVLSLFLFACVFSFQSANAGVSDSELVMFVKAAKAVQQIEDQTEVEMITVINDNGMKMDRYIELVKMDMDGNTGSVSAEELEKFSNAKKKIEEIKNNMEQKQVEAIKAEGLDVKRYSEIAEAANEDPELAGKINAEMQK